MKELLKFVILCVGLVLGTHACAQAQAQRTHCSYNFQDSSCGSVIRTAAQSPPACSTAPGWTTGAAAQWQGSHFSSPQCNYQAPPSCPSGWIETVGPSWNGSAWVGMSCQIPAQPGPNTCQYGFASGPSWNGSAWVYSCKSAPTVTCASEAQSQGYTLTNGYGTSGPFTGYYTKFDGSYGYGTYKNVEYLATGPVWNDVCANTGNTWVMSCTVSPTDGSVMGQLTGSPYGAQSASQCSGVN
ncbi:hypothetical protein P3T25_005308 [Paraburkholderia sp. GAS32]